jgi:hypothetical protein
MVQFMADPLCASVAAKHVFLDPQLFSLLKVEYSALCLFANGQRYFWSFDAVVSALPGNKTSQDIPRAATDWLAGYPQASL